MARAQALGLQPGLELCLQLEPELELCLQLTAAVEAQRWSPRAALELVKQQQLELELAARREWAPRRAPWGASHVGQFALIVQPCVRAARPTSRSS